MLPGIMEKVRNLELTSLDSSWLAVYLLPLVGELLSLTEHL